MDAEQIRQISIKEINILSEAEINAEIRRATAEERNYFLFQHRLANGEIRPVEVHSSPVIIDGKPLLFSIIYDISERKRIETALARSEAISASMLQAIPLPVFYKDIDSRYLGCNEAFARLTGLSQNEIIGRTVHEVWHQESAAVFEYQDQTMFDSEERLQIYEAQLNNEHGELRDVVFHKAIIFDETNAKIGLIGVILDITERKRSEEHSRQLAFYDPLTNLPNRRLINKRLHHSQSNSAYSKLHSSLLFLDLDNFKPLNDEHGHDAGDRLLNEVSRRLKQSVRVNDSVCRLAGDEFVVILEALSEDRAQAEAQTIQLAEKIRQELGKSYVFASFQHHCTVSIGAVVFRGHEVNGQDLLKQADQAMYQAKNRGRNRISLYPGH